MIEYAKSSRFPFRRWLVAAALGSAALTTHANLSLVNYNGFEVRQSGNTWTFSHEPPSSTALRGGTVLPNAAVSTSQRALVASKTLPVGKGLVVDVVAKIPAASLGRLIVGAAKVATPIGAVVSAAELLSYFRDQGITSVKNTPDGLTASVVMEGTQYLWSSHGKLHGSPEQACSEYLKNSTAVFSGVTDAGNGVFYCQAKTRTGTIYVSGTIGRALNPAPEHQTIGEPAILDLIAAKSGWPSSAAIAAQKAINMGVPVSTETPTVSGPSNIIGEKTTSSESVRLNPGTNTPSAPGATNTDPGTKTTTKTQSHKAEYSGNSVKTSTTTNTVTNITNNITNVTTTEISNEIKEDDQKPDICEKNPDALMCQRIDLDTPEGEIPKTEKRVEFMPDGSFGGGYCPSDKYQTIKGQNLLIVNWSQNCDAITTWVKPIVIAMSIFMAFMIVSGASRE